MNVPTQAKQAARDVLQGHPGLKNNRLYYELQRWRAYRDIAVRPDLTAREDLLRTLVDGGVVVLPAYLSSAKASDLLGALEDTMEGARSGRLSENVSSVQPEISCRVMRIDQAIPATRRFFDDPMPRSVAQAYMSPRVASYRRELDYRYGLSEVAQADLYHFDNWRPICKAFLYLTDVTQENAPFVYVPGTHRQGGWKRRHELAYDVYGPEGPFGHLLPQEMRALRREFGWEDLVCTGEAGTLILADLRGLHRGTPLRTGRRAMLTNVFDLMNPDATEALG